MLVRDFLYIRKEMPGRKIEGGKKKSTKCLGPDNIKSEKVLRNSYEGND